MKPTDIVLDVYKHVEFQHLEISIEPKTFRIFEGRKDLEAWFQRDNLDIKQLIEDGILFKVKNIILNCNYLFFVHAQGIKTVHAEGGPKMAKFCPRSC